MKFVIPLAVFSSVCFVEILLIQSWFENTLGDRWPVLIVGFVFPLLALFVLIEFDLRLRHRSKRRLKIKKRGLAFHPGDRSCFWKSVGGFRFLPIAGQSQLKRCIVLGFDRKRKTFVEWPNWSLALDAEQRSALVRSVSAVRSVDLGNFRIEEPETVEPLPQPRRVPLLAMSVQMVGLYLFLHGMSLMGFFLTDEKTRSPETPSNARMSKAKAEQIAKFVIERFHIHDAHELRTFGLWTGVSLTVVGLGGFAAGAVLMKRAE